MTEYEILPSGFQDIANGRDFYDGKDEGLGDAFMAAVFAEIESLRLYAGIHRKVWGYHRMLVETFPYAVFYKIIEGKILVFRVLDLRRNPKRNRTALR